MPRARLSSAAVLGALKIADLVLLGKGLHSASLGQAVRLEHRIYFFDIFNNFYNFLLWFKNKMTRYLRTFCNRQS